jgi:hypothetical protein
MPGTVRTRSLCAIARGLTRGASWQDSGKAASFSIRVTGSRMEAAGDQRRRFGRACRGCRARRVQPLRGSGGPRPPVERDFSRAPSPSEKTVRHGPCGTAALGCGGRLCTAEGGCATKLCHRVVAQGQARECPKRCQQSGWIVISHPDYRRADAGEHPERSTRRRGMLPDRAGLGAVATVLSKNPPQGLCASDGGAQQRFDRRCPP